MGPLILIKVMLIEGFYFVAVFCQLCSLTPKLGITFELTLLLVILILLKNVI